MLAIADLAGADWPVKARTAASRLMGAAEDSDPIVDLLTDIHEILTTVSGSMIGTADLLAKLTAREDRPWATWRKDDKPITGRGLARLLGPLGVHPGKQGDVRGYRTDAFEDAMSRYLPSHVSKCLSTNNDGAKVTNTSRFRDEHRNRKRRAG